MDCTRAEAIAVAGGGSHARSERFRARPRVQALIRLVPRASRMAPADPSRIRSRVRCLKIGR